MAIRVHVYYVCFSLLLVFVVVRQFCWWLLSEQVTVISVPQGVSGYKIPALPHPPPPPKHLAQKWKTQIRCFQTEGNVIADEQNIRS